MLYMSTERLYYLFFFQAEDGIRDLTVTGVQTCALPIFRRKRTEPDRVPQTRRVGNAAQHPTEAVVKAHIPAVPRYLLGRRAQDAGHPPGRSEERRVGKECRSRWSPYH